MNDKIVRKTILDTDIDTFQTADTLEVVRLIQEAAKLDNANETAARNAFPLRPSSALKGARDLYYGLENWKTPGKIPTTKIEGRNSMLLGLGHVIEKELVSRIKRVFEVPFTGLAIEYGVIKTADGASIVLGGELDLIVNFKGELVLCDSKSSADFPFKKDEAKDEHVAQLNLYLHSKFCRDNNINRAWIWMYNKNNSDLKVFEFYYDKQLAEATIARFQKVYSMWERGEVPAQEHVLGADWQSSYSQFRDYEWKPFEAPKLSRNRIKLSEPQTFALPNEKKALFRYFVKTYGIQVVETSDGREICAVKRGDQMFLEIEDADGFSS